MTRLDPKGRLHNITHIVRLVGTIAIVIPARKVLRVFPVLRAIYMFSVSKLVPKVGGLSRLLHTSD